MLGFLFKKAIRVNLGRPQGGVIEGTCPLLESMMSTTLKKQSDILKFCSQVRAEVREEEPNEMDQNRFEPDHFIKTRNCISHQKLRYPVILI